MKKRLLDDVKSLYNTKVRPLDINSFIVLYGGSTYKQDSNSDLDMLVYLDSRLDEGSQKLINEIKDIHKKNNLVIDNEVPVENKLLYQKTDVVNALNLRCFSIDQSGSKVVNEVVKNDLFLKSYEIKLRLLLNALTTPHLIIGNQSIAEKFIKNANNSITTLAILIRSKTNFSLNDLYSTLTTGQGGQKDEFYLGYKTSFPEVEIKLKSLLLDSLFYMQEDGLVIKNGKQYKLAYELNMFADRALSYDKKVRDLEILNEENYLQARDHFITAVDIGMNFKLKTNVKDKDITEKQTRKIIYESLPEDGKDLGNLIEEFKEEILPYCYNFSSPNFLGFPDSGNSTAGITGAIISDFLQQNLINQSFCSPSGTFVEIATIRWLREIVGYRNPKEVKDINDVGGIVTFGGTGSNAAAMMLARENFKKNTMTSGVEIEDDFYLIVPKGIGHYSVKSAQMWTGCGNRLLEVDTVNFKYDLNTLNKVLSKYHNKVMGLVAYAGDSRTMTVDDLSEVAKIVRSYSKKIWLHADACHGFSLGLSKKHKHVISGIEEFDSITTDPHKVMNIPYTLSALLVKDPSKLKMISSMSDLIMQERYAFGQLTPNIGSKPWLSLKLWFAIRNIGRRGFENIVDNRVALAHEFKEIIDESPDFVSLNDVNINSVAFLYTGGIENKGSEIDQINSINKKIHTKLIKDGKFHLHQFSIEDPGVFRRGEIVFPLRFMSGNPITSKKKLFELLDYVRVVAKEVS